MKVQKMIRWALDIAADDTHGYSQVNREGNPDYDCSSFVSDALKAAGFPVTGYYTTRELYNVLIKLGWKSLTTDDTLEMRIGDILLTPGHHVVIVSAPGKIVHARSDENGGIQGKKPGDQTGHEIEESVYYVPSYGWEYHLRYTENDIIEMYDNTDYLIAALLINTGIWTEVQARTNNFDLSRLTDETKAIACSALVMQGIYGNMPERKELIEKQGMDYEKVRKYVNLRTGKYAVTVW